MANGQLSGKDLVQDSAFQVFERLDKVIADQIKNMNELEKATRAALGGSKIGANADDLTSAVRKSNNALTEQEKVLRELARTRERNTTVSNDSLRQLAEERVKRSELNRLLKDEAIASGALSSAYKKLRKQRDLAGNTLRDLVASEKASNRELRRAQKEFDRLDKRVKKADRAIGNFRDNVGNYGSAVQGVVGFSKQLLGAFGIFSTIQIGQEIFETVKQLDALRFGLEQVTESQVAFNQAQQFLDEVADRSGADLLTLTNRYTNFLAAAKSTTLTLKQTQEIFENVVVAGAALGRSQDDINGSLRALEQILSKGKVQAEELRGQLGERLPGAFQILEKALELPVGGLNDLLEAGGLLSTEAIPALTKGLENAFSLDTINRVETLVASQGRLTNEFNIFIRGLEDGNGVISTTIRLLFDGLTSVVKVLQQLNGQDVLSAEAAGQANGYALAIDAVTKAAKEQNITFAEAAEQILPRYNNILEEYGDILKKVTDEQSSSAVLNAFNQLTGKFDEQQKTAARSVGQINLYSKALEALKEIIATGQLPEDFDEVSDAAKKNEDTLEALRAKLKALRDEFEVTDFNSARFQELRVEIKQLDDLIKRLTGSLKANKEAFEEIAVAGSIDFAQGAIKFLEKTLDATEVGSVAWIQYSKDLKLVREELKKLEDQAALLGGDTSVLDFFDDDDFDIADRVSEFLNNEGLDVVLGDLSNRLKLVKEEVVSEYIDIYGRDFDKFKEFEENKIKQLKLYEREKLEIRRNSLDLADALADAFLEINLNRLDEEQERQNQVFDSIVNNKESSEEAIRIAELDRAEAERKIERERQKRETQAFFFRQAIAVADIFLADSLARANAVASTAAIVPYLPLGAATLASLQGLITVNTALALGTVLAQSIPKFFYKGKGLGDQYEGPGIWGELQREVKLSKDGQIEISPDGASPTYVKSTDIILESLGKFRSQLGVSNSETSKRVRKGIKRTSDNSYSALVKPSGDKKNDKELERILERSVARGLSRAKLNPKFNIFTDVKVRRVP